MKVEDLSPAIYFGALKNVFAGCLHDSAENLVTCGIADQFKGYAARSIPLELGRSAVT